MGNARSPATGVHFLSRLNRSFFPPFHLLLLVKPWTDQAFAGTIYNVILGNIDVDIDSSILDNTELLERVAAQNATQNGHTRKPLPTYLLSQVITAIYTVQCTAHDKFLTLLRMAGYVTLQYSNVSRSILDLTYQTTVVWPLTRIVVPYAKHLAVDIPRLTALN